MISNKVVVAFVLVLGGQFALADTWVMDNQGKGKIVLTDRKCKESKSLYYAYTYTDKAFLEGCWALMDGKVHVAWNNKQRRVYEMNDFVQDYVDPKKSKSDGGQNSNPRTKGEPL